MLFISNKLGLVCICMQLPYLTLTGTSNGCGWMEVVVLSLKVRQGSALQLNRDRC